MARLTPAGTIIDVNDAFATLVGRTADRLAGAVLFDLLEHADAQALRDGDLATFSGGRSVAEVHFSADPSPIPVRATIALARRSDDAADSLVLTVEDLRLSRSREAALERLRLHDEATGLPNTELLSRQVDAAIGDAGPAERFALLTFEVAGPVPETSGLAGAGLEAVALQLGARLRGLIRPTDRVGRTGPNEFAVLLDPIAEADLAEGVGRRLLAFVSGHAGLALPIRLGVALFPDQGDSATALLRQARLDMYLGSAAAAPSGAEAGGSAGGAEARTEDVDEPDGDPGLHDRVADLEPVSLFLSLPTTVIRRLARYMSEQTAVPGEALDGPGTPAALRIVREGTCEIHTEGPNGQLSLLTLGPGDFMGAPGLVLDNPLAVSVRALTNVRLLVLNGVDVARTAPPGSAFRAALDHAAGQRDGHLRSLLERPRRATIDSKAVQVSVYSTKGGSGRTTLAMNMAAELGRRRPGEVLLVDMALPYNHVALLTGLSPSTCLARIAKADDAAFGPLVWSAVLPHKAGFMVLPAALRAEEADLVTPDLLARALRVLAPQFGHVIFDLGVALDDCVLAALELSDDLVLVATPELASMHDTRQLIDLATRVLHIPNGRVHTVLNHRSPDSALTRKVVEEVLGRSMTAEFGYYGARPELAGLEGGLQVQTDARGPFTKSVRALVDDISGPARARTA